MKQLQIVIVLLLPFLLRAQMPPILFEETQGKETPEYHDVIAWWKNAAKASDKIQLLTMGTTDAGYPLHLSILSNKNFDVKKRKKASESVILILNGIHPGEPDGIDASMILARDIANGNLKLPDNIVLAIVPVYNIGGCLNRGENYRVNQDGPIAFGFRGNSQNFDLNRDFIKADTKEAIAFAEIFHLIDPDIFVDNHVSNGADYQHIMTLLSSQHNKLGGDLGKFLHEKMEPGIYDLMKAKNYDLVPYVNFWGNQKVQDGWPAFWDAPRYSTGYASLWNTISFMPESHMLKPYKERVLASRALMQSFIEFTSANSSVIKQLRNQAKLATINASQFPIKWTLDKTKTAPTTFKGFESGYKKSDVSGTQRLYYDQTKPYTTTIPFFNYFNPVEHVQKPQAYLIPQGWWKVIERLKANNIEMQPLANDTSVEVTVYRIEDFHASEKPYEGHHPNTQTKVSTHKQKVAFRKGDWYIPLNQEGNRFLIETLEPVAEDSYFTWNFFDAVLAQKEGYSAYAFEETAAAYLKENPELKQLLAEKVKQDTEFANNGTAQLRFIFNNSKWLEPDYLKYPVYRVE